MKKARGRGFTLIELLTVIAIIGILAGITAVLLPRALEKGKVAATIATMGTIRSGLIAYYTSNQSFPPAYGFKRVKTPADISANSFYLLPYYGLVGETARDAYLDTRFSDSQDSNRNSIIDALEFVPIGRGTATIRTFPQVLYIPGGPNADPDLANDVGLQLQPGQPGTFLYVPVYSRDIENVVKWAEGNTSLSDEELRNRLYMRAQFSGNKLDYLFAPDYMPPRYDRFVLISRGPFQNTGGILGPYDPSGTLGGLLNENIMHTGYYLAALRAYYLATRDLNGDGRLDFDFTARTQQNAATPGLYDSFRPGLNLHLLPDNTNLGGPIIIKGE